MPETDIDKRVKDFEKAVKDSLEKSRGYILGEVIKIAQGNDGIVDLNQPNMNELIEVFLKTDPKDPKYFNADGTKKENPPISFKATLNEQEERINALIKGDPEKGKPLIDSKYFDDIREYMADFKEKLYDDLSKQEKLEQAVNNRVRDNRIFNDLNYANGIDENGITTTMYANEKLEVISKVGKDIQLPDQVMKIAVKDDRLLSPVRKAFNDRAIECFNNDSIGKRDDMCFWDSEKVNNKEALEKYNRLVSHDMQAFSVIQEKLDPNISVEENKKVTTELLPTISKLPPEELQKKGSKIVEYFAPLLESKNPALVNGIKTALAELDPKYLAEAGETIANNLQKAAKTNILQKIIKFLGGPDYAQKNIDKAINSLKEASNKLTIFQNLGQDKGKGKGIDIVPPGQEQGKATPQGYKSSISTPSHAQRVSESRKSGQQPGRG